MKVKCIDKGMVYDCSCNCVCGYGIKFGSSYDVVRQDDMFYYIKTKHYPDGGGWLKDRFEVVKEEECNEQVLSSPDTPVEYWMITSLDEDYKYYTNVFDVHPCDLDTKVIIFALKITKEQYDKWPNA